MTVDEAIEQARWYEREDIATTLRESALAETGGSDAC